MKIARSLFVLQILLGSTIIPAQALADSLLDYIRGYDLNDYALGVAVSVSQNPYVGAESGGFAYPYLTSFNDSAFTDDWFLIRGSSFGARWISDNDWEVSGLARVQTLSFGDSKSDLLAGVADRKWSVEAGPGIGWRGWPVHLNLSTYSEITDRHDGLISELSISLPMEFSRGYFIPSIEAVHMSSDYANYYYAVTDAEANATRPAYRVGSASNLAIKARWGYALTEKWLLSGSLGLQQLDEAISDSPIVARDSIASASIGLAYNTDIFQPRDYDFSAPEANGFELRVAAFLDSVQSSVSKDASNGVPGFEVDLEDLLGGNDESSVLQLDASIRMGHYHRLEFGYFELGRSSTIALSREVTLGDESFISGTNVNTRVESKVFHAGYGYSLVRDAQKEIGIMVGVHITDFSAEFSAPSTGQSERSDFGSPLPVIGAHAAIFVNEKLTVGAKVQMFRTDFDRYEGSLNYATLDLSYRLGKSSSIGLGYNYYGLKLTSTKNALGASLNIRHSGPIAFFSIGY